MLLGVSPAFGGLALGGVLNTADGISTTGGLKSRGLAASRSGDSVRLLSMALNRWTCVVSSGIKAFILGSGVSIMSHSANGCKVSGLVPSIVGDAEQRREVLQILCQFVYLRLLKYTRKTIPCGD